MFKYYNKNISHVSILFVCDFVNEFILFQYYEMSYGLNVEMHKQVRTFKNIICQSFIISHISGFS